MKALRLISLIGILGVFAACQTIEELEGIIASLEEELSSVTDTSKILELTAKYEAAKSELDAKMEEWAELSE